MIFLLYLEFVTFINETSFWYPCSCCKDFNGNWSIWFVNLYVLGSVSLQSDVLVSLIVSTRVTKVRFWVSLYWKSSCFFRFFFFLECRRCCYSISFASCPGFRLLMETFWFSYEKREVNVLLVTINKYSLLGCGNSSEFLEDELYQSY